MHEFISLKRSRASLPLLRLFSVVLIASLIILPAGALAAPDNAPESAPANAALTNKVIFFASDGMRPDLVDKYAGEGLMPTYADLMAKGVKGDNGLTQAFPPPILVWDGTRLRPVPGLANTVPPIIPSIAPGKLTSTIAQV